MEYELYQVISETCGTLVTDETFTSEEADKWVKKLNEESKELGSDVTYRKVIAV